MHGETPKREKNEGNMCRKWRGEIAHSALQAVRTPRLGREWGVVSKEEAQNLALQKGQAEEPIHNIFLEKTVYSQTSVP